MINAIRSNPVSLFVLLLALAAQVPHALTVFYEASHVESDTNWWLSLTFAIALESAVLMFVIHGWHKFSYAFAASSILVNMAYYDMLPETFVKILVSVILPVAIACYSHLVAGDAHMPHGRPIDWRDIVTRVKNRLTNHAINGDDSSTDTMPNHDTPRGTSETAIDENAVDTADALDKSVTLAKSDNGTPSSGMPKSDDSQSLTPAQRRSQLSEVIIDRQDVTTSDIDNWAELYSVSQRTIRRDIDGIFSTNGIH